MMKNSRCKACGMPMDRCVCERCGWWTLRGNRYINFPEPLSSRPAEKEDEAEP